jgi:DNA-binding MarR family transcriptional regulator
MVKPSYEQSLNITIPEDAKPFIAWDERGGQMTCRQVAICLIIKNNPGMTVGAVAHVLNCPKPSVTRSVDKLESLGLIMRVSDPDDGRLVLLMPKRGK